MGCLRFAMAVFTALVVFLPSMRSGSDAHRLLQRSASAAEFQPDDLVAATDAQRSSISSGEGVRPVVDGPSSPTPQAFGYGALTGFYPSQTPRELVLSFDDGPDLKFTPLVLDELDKRGLKAIFFVTGHRVVGDRPEDFARRELLRKIAAHGHLVANHTMTHRNLCQGPDDAAMEIDTNAEVIASATGLRPLLFRAPYGARCHRLEATLAARELISVGWNLDPQDWRNPTSDDILGYLELRLRRLQGRGILLLHDTHPASVFALGPLLDWIARENRLAVAAGQPPIVLQDYSVFLPALPIPPTGIETVVASIARGLLPSRLLAER